MESKPKVEDDWPSYLPRERDVLLACGVIALNYGSLEGRLRALFTIATQMESFQAAAIFDRLSNNHRIDALQEIVSTINFPSEIREAIARFCKAFTVCAENRHAIMHAHPGGWFRHRGRGERRGISLRKFSKSGAQLMCTPTAQELRQIADCIHEWDGYGESVVAGARAFAKDPDGTSWQAMIETPPQLHRLNWRESKLSLTGLREPALSSV